MHLLNGETLMNAEHYFLGDSETQVPARWRQAFAAGRLVSLADLPSLADTVTPVMVWLSCDETDWQDRLKVVCQQVLSARVVVLSSAPHPQQGLLAFDAGARGYTHTHAVVDLMREVALVIQHGGLWVGPELLQRLVGATFASISKLTSEQRSESVPNVWASLSPRETQVARLVASGQSNKEVATKLFISERTVKAHLGVVFEKLGVRDRLQLALRVLASPGQESSTHTAGT